MLKMRVPYLGLLHFPIRSESEREGYTDHMSQDRHHSLGTQVDCADWNTETFFEAAEVSDVIRCLQAGANLEARNEYGSTPLHGAKTGEAVTALLEAGADLMARDNDGSTPLHEAARFGTT